MTLSFHFVRLNLFRMADTMSTLFESSEIVSPPDAKALITVIIRVAGLSLLVLLQYQLIWFVIEYVGRWRRQRVSSSPSAGNPSRSKQPVRPMQSVSARRLKYIAFRERLKHDGLAEVEMPGDNHCLFHALATQMNTLYHTSHTFKTMRIAIAEYMRKNMMTYLPFVSNNEMADGMDDDLVEFFDGYCTKMGYGKAWGGDPEVSKRD